MFKITILKGLVAAAMIFLSYGIASAGKSPAMELIEIVSSGEPGKDCDRIWKAIWERRKIPGNQAYLFLAYGALWGIDPLQDQDRRLEIAFKLAVLAGSKNQILEKKRA